MHFKSTATYAALALGTIANAAQVGDSGKLSSLMGGLQGDVVVTSDNTLTVDDYELQMIGGPPLYWYGSMTNDIPHGFRISEESVSTLQKTPGTATIKLDAGKTLADFDYVGLWCEPYKILFGQTKLVSGGNSTASNSTASITSSASSTVASPTATTSSAAAATGNSGVSLKLSGLILATTSLMTAVFLM